MSNGMIGSGVVLATLFLAAAQEGEAQKLYGGFHLTPVVYSVGATDHPEDGPRTVAHGVTMALGARIGVRFSEYHAIEIYSGLGLNDNEHSFSAFYGQEKVKEVRGVDRFIGMRGRIYVFTDDQPIKSYATLGLARIDETISGTSVYGSTTSDYSSRYSSLYPSYGLGFEFKWPRHKNIWGYAEFTGYVDHNAISAGINFDFGS